jgi:hypothetical protein
MKTAYTIISLLFVFVVGFAAGAFLGEYNPTPKQDEHVCHCQHINDSIGTEKYNEFKIDESNPFCK